MAQYQINGEDRYVNLAESTHNYFTAFNVTSTLERANGIPAIETYTSIQSCRKICRPSGATAQYNTRYVLTISSSGLSRKKGTYRGGEEKKTPTTRSSKDQLKLNEGRKSQGTYANSSCITEESSSPRFSTLSHVARHGRHNDFRFLEAWEGNSGTKVRIPSKSTNSNIKEEGGC